MARNTTTLYHEVSSGIIEAVVGWDGEDRGFLIFAHAPDPTDNNKTQGEVYIAEDGEHFEHVDTIYPELKITSLKATTRKMSTPKERLVVSMVSRRGGTGMVEVDTNVELYTMDNVWAPKAAPAPTPEPPITCVPPGNRPYFRPNRTITRAQACKMIAIALGLPEPVAGTQSFEDIPEGSTFHEWVEAMYAAGAINGYPCEG